MTTRYRLWLCWLATAACVGSVLAVQLGTRGLIVVPLVVLALDGAGYLALQPAAQGRLARQQAVAESAEDQRQRPLSRD